jgi:hypothetical protein
MWKMPLLTGQNVVLGRVSTNCPLDGQKWAPEKSTTWRIAAHRSVERRTFNKKYFLCITGGCPTPSRHTDPCLFYTEL